MTMVVGSQLSVFETVAVGRMLVTPSAADVEPGGGVWVAGGFVGALVAETAAVGSEAAAEEGVAPVGFELAPVDGTAIAVELSPGSDGKGRYVPVVVGGRVMDPLVTGRSVSLVGGNVEWPACAVELATGTSVAETGAPVIEPVTMEPEDAAGVPWRSVEVAFGSSCPLVTAVVKLPVRANEVAEGGYPLDASMPDDDP